MTRAGALATAPPPAQEARMADPEQAARAPLLPEDRAAQLAAEFGLKPDEYERFLARIAAKQSPPKSRMRSGKRGV